MRTRGGYSKCGPPGRKRNHLSCFVVVLPERARALKVIFSRPGSAPIPVTLCRPTFPAKSHPSVGRSNSSVLQMHVGWSQASAALIYLWDRLFCISAALCVLCTEQVASVRHTCTFRFHENSNDKLSSACKGKAWHTRRRKISTPLSVAFIFRSSTSSFLKELLSLFIPAFLFSNWRAWLNKRLSQEFA